MGLSKVFLFSDIVLLETRLLSKLPLTSFHAFFVLSKGDSLLHMAADNGREEAGLFLASHGAQPNHTNKQGEMPLHVAARKGLARLVSELLNK